MVAAELLLEDKSAWTVTCVSMGNPHAIVFATRDGKQFEVRCQLWCMLIQLTIRLMRSRCLA